MMGRRVDPGQGIEWLKRGWHLFLVDPGMWIVLAIALFVLSAVASMLPVVGQLGLVLASPGLGAGLITLARQVGERGKVDLALIISPFTDANVRTSVLAVGALAIVAQIAFTFVLLVIGLGTLIPVLSMTGGGDSVGETGAGAMIFVALLALTAAMVIGMAFTFAGPLAALQNFRPVDAIKTSLLVCLQNWLPLTVYSLLVTVLTVIAVLPMLLGLIILMPVLLGAYYASYRDLFPETGNSPSDQSAAIF